MSLELRKNSKKFYARIQVGGKRRTIALKTRWQGTPPPGLKMRNKGDEVFERSRAKAEEEAQNLSGELTRREDKISVIKRIDEIRTGRRIKEVLLGDLNDVANSSICSKSRSEQYIKGRSQTFNCFISFLQTQRGLNTNKMRANEVTVEMAEAFLVSGLEAGLTRKTVDNRKSDLRRIFNIAKARDLVAHNPFEIENYGTGQQESRKPFTLPELEKILHEAKEDPLLYQIITVAISTGMRLGDICELKWSSVNIPLQQITVPAAKKTCKPLPVPILPLLAAVLRSARDIGEGSEFVLPQAARLYRTNSTHALRARLDSILFRAGFTDDENPATSVRLTRKDGKGVRRVSVRGFHAFRTTWITIALSSGVPLATVRSITGETSPEVIMRNYFNPSIETNRAILAKKLPALLVGTSKAADSGRVAAALRTLAEGVERMSVGELRSQLLDLAERA